MQPDLPGMPLHCAQPLPAGDMIIAGYWPIKSEIDPVPLMAALADAGYQTACHRHQSREPLVFHLWQPGDALVDGFTARRSRRIGTGCQPDCLLVPMLAFDAGSFALVTAAAFMTAALNHPVRQARVIAVGIAYPEQEVASVPTGPHDARLDAVLTPMDCCTRAPQRRKPDAYSVSG